MSEDASPTGGQRTPPNEEAAIDSNSSIIEKVRSRVSSIIPFSKWFSPTIDAAGTPSGEDGSRNGGIRRRREETVIRERVVERNCEEDESEVEDADEDEIDRAPPSKRSRLNVSEVQSPIGSLQNTYSNVTKSFASSTPTTVASGRRKQMGIKSAYQPLRGTISDTTTRTIKTTSTIASRSISDLRSENDDNGDDADVLEIIPEHRPINLAGPVQWERSTLSTDRSSGIRELKLPSRRPSLHSTRGNGPSLSTSPRYTATLANSYYRNQDNDDPPYEGQAEEDDYDDKKSDILVNGVRVSPNLISADTASESGESQMSSTQKIKSTSLYGAGVKRFRNSSVGGISYTAHLQGKKSLFGDRNMPSHLNNSTTSLTSLNRRQSFNASLYGSTSALSDSRLLNIYSPFYKGCTTYGGASAYSKHLNASRRANPASASLVRPSSSLSTSSTASNVPETSSAISNTAKRILELMNQFTTPLSDVKKMANNMKVPALTAHRQRFGDADRTINRGISMAMPKTPYSRPSSTTSSIGDSEAQTGPPLHELHVPSMSQLLQMKKLHSSTERAREITRMNQAKCLASIQTESRKEQEYTLPPVHDTNNSTKHVNKIKNKLTRTRTSAKSFDDDLVQAPVLPDIPLPLNASAVPVINIDITNSVSQSKVGIPSIDSGVADSKSSDKSNDKAIMKTNESENITPKTNKPEFSFISPVVNKVVPPQQTSQSGKSIIFAETNKPGTLLNGGEGFTFAAPIQVLGSDPQASRDNALSGSTFKFSDPTPILTTMKSSNTVDNFTYQLNNTSRTTSVLTTAVKTNNANIGGVPAVAAQLKTSGSVIDAFKKPVSADSTSTNVSSSSTTFGAQFKMSSDKWECSTCLVRNENTADKCISCSTPKDTPTTAIAAEPNKTQISLPPAMPAEAFGSAFGDKFKPTSDTWECPTCMIRNNSSLSQCEACNTANPNGQALASASKVSSSFSVPNKTTDPGFKNIVASQSAKWECTACMTHNEPTRNKCACCEQAKPGAVSDSTPQFSFGTSASAAKFTFGFAGKKEENLKSEQLTSSTPAEAANKGFAFGATSSKSPVANASANTGSFSFGFKATGEAPAKPSDSTSTKKEAANSNASKPIFGSTPQPVDENSSKSSTGNEKPVKSASESAESPAFKIGTPISTSAFSSPSIAVVSTKNTISSESPVTSNTSLTSSSSIFKPIGNIAFGGSTEKKAGDTSKQAMFSFGSGLTKTASTETPAATVTGGTDTNILSSGIRSKDDKLSSTETSATSKLFAFGSSSAVGNKTSEFSFGTPSSIAGAGFKNPLGQKLETSLVPKTGVTSTSFVFGKPSTPASVTPTFGAISSNVITSSNPSGPVSTTAPSFSAIGAPTTVSTFQPVMTQAMTSSAFGSGSGPAQTTLFGNNNLSSASSSNSALANKPATNLFQFGAGTKPAESATTTASAPIFGNVSSTTSARFSFGSSSSAPSAAPAQPFVFGSSGNADKRSESSVASNVFGSASIPAQNNAVAPTLPGFGSFSSPSTLQTQQQPLQQAQPLAFGQTAALGGPFGSTLSNATPTFGSAPSAPGAVGGFGSGNSTFGSSGASAFGSPAAKIPLFSGSGFGSATASSGDDPAAKKQATGFNFSTPQQNSSGGFSFSSSNINNNNTNKQPFNFTATASPSFNFTGGPEGANAPQPFQFGAPQIPPAAFNFSGIETASNAPFQFSAAPAANNIFAVTPTPGSSQSAVQMRRKAKIATRRTQPR